jgi:hypothetical protein
VANVRGLVRIDVGMFDNGFAFRTKRRRDAIFPQQFLDTFTHGGRSIQMEIDVARAGDLDLAIPAMLPQRKSAPRQPLSETSSISSRAQSRPGSPVRPLRILGVWLRTMSGGSIFHND